MKRCRVVPKLVHSVQEHISSGVADGFMMAYIDGSSKRTKF